MPEETPNEVQISTTYEASEKELRVIKTPDKIVPVETIYNID